MVEKSKTANRLKRKKYGESVIKNRHEREGNQGVYDKTPEEQPAKLLHHKGRSEKFLLENFAKTYFQKTPAMVYGSSRKPISITTSYVNEEGNLPYIEITTKMVGSGLPPCKIRTSEKGLEFETIMMISKNECDIIKGSNLRNLFGIYEATKDPQIRDQLSAIEKTFQNKMFYIRKHLFEGTSPEHNN